MARRRNPWIRVAWNAWALGWEASSVIGLRTIKIAAGGPAAKTEAGRMASEKVDAALAWQALAMTGALGIASPEAASNTLTHYRRKVRKNRRRLQKC